MTVRFITITLAGLTLVNAYSFASLYSSTAAPDLKIMATAAPITRTPAAIEKKQVEVADLKSHLSHDLNCQKNQKLTGLTVQGQWAQLKGRVCGNDKLKLVEITNLNNGFTAAVFGLGLEKYQTDLIQLVPGQNKIRIRITPVKGSVQEQTLLISSSHM